MASIDYIQGAAGVVGQDAFRGFAVIPHVFDCALRPRAANDVCGIFGVAVGWMVLALMAELLTPEGAVATADFGDDVLVAGYIPAFDLNAPVGTMAFSNNPFAAPGVADVDIQVTARPFGLIGGKGYAVANNIDAKFNNAAVLAKFRATVAMVNLRSLDTVQA